MIIFIMLGLLGTQCVGFLRVATIKGLKENAPNMLNFTESGECVPSFECDILNAVCDYMNETCTVVPLPNFEAIGDAIEDGNVNLSVSFPVSSESAESVHFVRPHYYYAGSQVYVLDTVPESEHPTWEDLRGKNVCIPHKWYAKPAIKFLYGVNFFTTFGSKAEYIINGTCEYIITASIDGSHRFQGLAASTQAPVMFGVPVAIAVSIDERNGLGARIGEALINIMDDGLDSLILEFERRNLICCGYPPNKKLSSIVMAITQHGGALPPAEEDAIWDT